MRTLNLALLVAATVTLVPAAAAERMSFQEYLDDAKQCPSGTTQDYPNHTVFVCNKGLTTYIITKPNHPAYPRVIIQKLVTEGGSTYGQTDGQSFTDEDSAFRE